MFSTEDKDVGMLRVVSSVFYGNEMIGAKTLRIFANKFSFARDARIFVRVANKKHKNSR